MIALKDHQVNIIKGYNRTLENTGVYGRSFTPMTNNPKYSIIHIP